MCLGGGGTIIIMCCFMNVEIHYIKEKIFLGLCSIPVSDCTLC